MSFLLLWSCGPVQDFIASARKGRDLWFGSWLLSEVSTAAAACLVDEGATLLLPAPADTAELRESDFDVPNKVLVRLNTESTEEVRRIGEAASSAARDRIEALARDTFDRLPEHLFDRGPALDQVREFLETAWASAPLGDSFRDSRRRVEALLAARKTARDFTRAHFAAVGVPKSSLDGAREAVTKKNAGLRLGLTHNERLSGLGLLKRLGHQVAADDAQGGRVASVSAFALASWLRPLVQDDEKVTALKDALGAFYKALDAIEEPRLQDLGGDSRDPLLGAINSHALYANRLHELVDATAGEPPPAEAHAKAFGSLFGKLLVHAPGLSRTPNPYYAILLADGDRMGSFLDAQESQAGVSQVSRALTDFARKVRCDVFAAPDLSRPNTLLRGQCIYAGGDDVLAFVPVDLALELAGQLRRLFARMMAPLAEETPGVPSPTLSVGICVAHHLTPLRDALVGARDAEKTAKGAGRDAWCVRVLKRSGAPTTATSQWPTGAHDRLIKLGRRFSGGDDSGGVPHGLPYAIRDAALQLRSGLDEDDSVPVVIERGELIRILKQKSSSDSEADALLSLLWPLAAEDLTLSILADHLVVARALTGMGGAS